MVTPFANGTQDTPNPATATINLGEANSGKLNATEKERFLAIRCANVVTKDCSLLTPSGYHLVPERSYAYRRLTNTVDHTLRKLDSARQGMYAQVIQAEMEKLEKRGTFRPST